MAVRLSGFAAPQGNPDEIFNYYARMESTYQGKTIFVEESGQAPGGQQPRFNKFDEFNCPGCAVGGKFVSKLTVRISGKGELHIANSGIADLAGVPEPSSWMLMISGFGLAGWSIRRRRMAYI